MTDAVRAKAEEFREVILNSEEYRNYDMYRRLLNETPELKQKVNEFRKLNVYMQLTKRGDGGEIQQLAAEHTELLNNSVVREFMNSELILCRMLQKVNKILVSDIELELDFL